MFETTTRIISFELERSVTSTNTEDVIKFFSEIAEGNATFDASASFEPPELTRETFPKLMGSYRKLVRKKDHASMLALSGLMLKRAPNNPATAQMHTQSLIENERYDEALALCNKFRKVLDDALVWKLMECTLAFRKGDAKLAHKCSAEYAHIFPAVNLGASDPNTHKMCITTLTPPLVRQYNNPLGMRIGGNFVFQLASRYPKRFQFTSLYADASSTDRALERLEQPDIILNGAVNGEELGIKSSLEGAVKCAERWDIPCINHPRAAYETARDKLAKLLSGIDHLIVPKTQFINHDETDMMDATISLVESEFDYPLIIRKPMMQNGLDMHLCTNREEAIASIEEFKSGFFAIQYIENRVKKGLFRKYRGTFIGNNFHLTRLDYATDWKVHGHRNEPHRLAFYEEHSEFIKEEIDTAANPEKFLGANAMAALFSIRERINLDFFGIDFDVTEDGDVIVFEANAVMNLLCKAGMTLPHPKASEDALMADFFQLVEDKIANH